MKLPSTKSMTFIVGLSLGAVTLAVGIGISSRHAQAADLPPIELKQPACTCTSSSLSAGHVLYNCQCGGLQCVVTGSTNAAMTPAMFCTK